MIFTRDVADDGSKTRAKDKQLVLSKVGKPVICLASHLPHFQSRIQEYAFL